MQHTSRFQILTKIYALTFWQEFRNTVVKVLKIVGTALAIINGFIQPLSSLVYGELTDDLMIPPSGGNKTAGQGNGTANYTMNQNLTKTNFNPSWISQV